MSSARRSAEFREAAIGEQDFSAPALLLFGDDPAGRIEAIAARSGARVVPRRPIAGALDALDHHAGTCIALVEASVATPALEALLARLDAEAVAGRARAVAILAPALIDLGWALASHEDVALLADPSDEEIAAALTTALAPAPVSPSLREDGDRAAELRRLSEDARRIARTLAALSEDGTGYAAAPGVGAAPLPAAATIRALIRARRLRDRFFEPSLFADPAWDMLLDLMASRLEERAVSVSSLCIAAAVPSTTALRWVKALTSAGLLRRVADGLDGRRVFVELSDRAAEAIAAYFAEVRRLGLPGL